MKFKPSNIVLLSLTVLAVGYVIFDFQYEKHVENKTAEESLLLNYAMEGHVF